MPALSVYISDEDLARLDAYAAEQSKYDSGATNRSRGIRKLIREHAPKDCISVVRSRSRPGKGE